MGNISKEMEFPPSTSVKIADRKLEADRSWGPRAIKPAYLVVREVGYSQAGPRLEKNTA